MALGTHSHGTLLKKGSTTIAGVKSIGGPSLDKAEIDASYLDMPNKVKEYIAGLGEPGEIQFELQMTGSVLSALYADFLTGTQDSYSVTWPNGSVWSFDAYVKKIDNKTELDAVIMADCALKITGMPTFTP